MKLKIFSQGFLGALIVSTALASCTWDEVKPVKVTTPDSVKFSVNIIPIFASSCAKSGCHVTGAQTPDLSAANAYSSLIYYGYIDTDFPDQSSLYLKITSGSMKDKATDTDRALILKWIQQGALDN